jgi:hypothetical protein
MYVIKATGEKEPFSKTKYLESLARAGVPSASAQEVFRQIESQLHNEITTKKLYALTHQLLREKSKRCAGHYNLKQALIRLGPSGYPFEKFVSLLLEHEGYQVSVGQMVRGKCVEHEIDVIAQKDGSHVLVECKFHNTRENRSTLKVPLYVWARFGDVNGARSGSSSFDTCMLVTNTKFTSIAQDYGACVGIRMVAWGYPYKEGLEVWVARYNLHPITCLSDLSDKQAKALIGDGLVLCRDVAKADVMRVSRLGFGDERALEIIEECSAVCSHS